MKAIAVLSLSALCLAAPHHEQHHHKRGLPNLNKLLEALGKGGKGQGHADSHNSEDSFVDLKGLLQDGVTAVQDGAKTFQDATSKNNNGKLANLLKDGVKIAGDVAKDVKDVKGAEAQQNNEDSFVDIAGLLQDGATVVQDGVKTFQDATSKNKNGKLANLLKDGIKAAGDIAKGAKDVKGAETQQNNEDSFVDIAGLLQDGATIVQDGVKTFQDATSKNKNGKLANLLKDGVKAAGDIAKGAKDVKGAEAQQNNEDSFVDIAGLLKNEAKDVKTGKVNVAKLIQDGIKTFDAINNGEEQVDYFAALIPQGYELFQI